MIKNPSKNLQNNLIFPTEKDKILRPLKSNLFLTSAQADNLCFLKTQRISKKEFKASLVEGKFQGYPVYYEKGTTPENLGEELTLSFRIIKFFKYSKEKPDFLLHTPLVEQETVKILLVSRRLLNRNLELMEP